MLDREPNRDVITQIDESQRALIGKLLDDNIFVTPAVVSFTMGSLDVDEVLTGTYSANS
jgi:hypothetical protein